ncbi:MAG: 5-oxoprolinase subunit PxpA [Bowdeniella nasicola]|nr:5-oxoprolinase subunit PxpA [Bowdeniella nasicola]
MAIDLNSDSGESFGNWAMGDDQAMMKLVTSANIACGFHAGDPSVMRRTTRAAAEHDVAVGAHVAYRDLANFGRVFIDVPANELTDMIIYQLGALDAMARGCGTTLRYVKPHGALYNTIVHHEAHAKAVVRALQEFGGDLPILCLPNSEISRQAEAANIRPVIEAFADRAYTPDGTLVSRRENGAVLHDANEVSARMVKLVESGTITAIDGTEVHLAAESICVHGDTPAAVELASAVRSALTAAGIDVKAFT